MFSQNITYIFEKRKIGIVTYNCFLQDLLSMCIKHANSKLKLNPPSSCLKNIRMSIALMTNEYNIINFKFKNHIIPKSCDQMISIWNTNLKFTPKSRKLLKYMIFVLKISHLVKFAYQKTPPSVYFLT